ncbi:hypothetical protein NQ315_017565 [Exocentrus adspersus]|uniref:YqaJ viral recombinase domain-containing protein n=1 Tax=Exocentrus adspersus TaxID=1586481 RepID=A0AAV8VJH4_9CUCU|nr:hypothetical protein NQ315_017565 [Exocentrus adspersus]
MNSEYLHKLLVETPDVGEREMKIKLINDVDCRSLHFERWRIEFYDLTKIEFVDIIAYLVFTHSFYTKEQIKAYKSLQSYKYFESGFVIKLGTKIINDFVVLLGKVKHSQRANAKPLETWVIADKHGNVSTAHSTCMAGSREACSHVAILFAVNYFNSRDEGMSCTDVQCRWIVPSLSTTVPVVPVRDMNWGLPFIAQQPQEIQAGTKNELVTILHKVSALGHTSALMRIVEPFASSYLHRNSMQLILWICQLFLIYMIPRIIPKELMEISKSICYTITYEEKVAVEVATQRQAECSDWFKQRAGHITASKFRALQHCPKLILWGVTNENNAVEEYRKNMEVDHEEFIINDVGLIISTTFPQFGVSPDRIVYCECCLGGCLEVKCPYLLNFNNVTSIEQYLQMRSTCLLKSEGKVILNRTHPYYYQVQAQIFVSELLYCDFVIWSPNIFFKERILPNFEFWEKNYKIAERFHKFIIMPELLGRYFTQREGAGKIQYWCTCNGVDDLREMIKCENEDCQIQWFHYECVGLTEVPVSLAFKIIVVIVA